MKQKYRILVLVLSSAAVSVAGCGGSSPSEGSGGGRAAFVFTSERDGQDDLFLADADGRVVRRLTNDGFREHSPAVSPDGGTIAFVSNRDGGADRLYLIDADGKNVRRLENSVLSTPDGRGRTDPIPPRGMSPTFSPDGRQILFAVPTPQPGIDIYLMGRDGSGPVRIPVAATADTYSVAFHPDGRRVVFARGGDLYLASLDGSGETRLTETPDAESFPRYSPDGATIVFLNSVRNEQAGRLDSDLYRINADGTGRTRLTETGHESGATFSRDGATVYFSSYRDGDWELYSMAADGSGERRLSARRGYDGMPAAL